MTSSLGGILWGNIIAICLGIGLHYGDNTYAMDQLQFLIWYLLVIRVFSDVFAEYTVSHWVCIFCGRGFTGTIWQAFTSCCTHNPIE